MENISHVTTGQQQRALWLSTFAFTLCFAVWMIFAIIGLKIRQQLGLNDTQLSLMISMPVLSGSLVRLALGVWSDQIGGRKVMALTMLAGAAGTWMLTYAHSYAMFLIAALILGLAGGSFSVGIAYVSTWFPARSQGTALGIFGAGNVGAAVTKLCAPWVMANWGWTMVAYVWALVLAVAAVLFYILADEDPNLRERQQAGVKPQSFAEQMAPLKHMQVWRFSLYYFFTFGGFVALSLWLPRYLTGDYHVSIQTAGLLAACYSIPGSLCRIIGGWLSDKIGARKVMYWVLGMASLCSLILSVPSTTTITVVTFTVLVFVLGFFMALGKAAVYKHIPVYYPNQVGAVGGVVGLIGGLGGWILPIVWGVLRDLTGMWSTCFMLLFAVSALSLLWMHLAIGRMERRKSTCSR